MSVIVEKAYSHRIPPRFLRFLQGDINLRDLLQRGGRFAFRLVQGRNWRPPSHNSNAGPTIAIEISPYHSLIGRVSVPGVSSGVSPV